MLTLPAHDPRAEKHGRRPEQSSANAKSNRGTETYPSHGEQITAAFDVAIWNALGACAIIRGVAFAKKQGCKIEKTAYQRYLEL